MTRRFVHHVECASQHLQVAMDNLMTQDWKEALVSLRCFAEQLQLAQRLSDHPDCAKVLAELGNAGRLSEVFIRRTALGHRTSSSHDDEGSRY
jgi:hypothetical protein